MKQGVLQDESMEIHVASMSNGVELRTWRKQHNLKKNSGEEETRLKLKKQTSMDQEPYPN